MPPFADADFVYDERFTMSLFFFRYCRLMILIFFIHFLLRHAAAFRLDATFICADFLDTAAVPAAVFDYFMPAFFFLSTLFLDACRFSRLLLPLFLAFFSIASSSFFTFFFARFLIFR